MNPSRRGNGNISSNEYYSLLDILEEFENDICFKSGKCNHTIPCTECIREKKYLKNKAVEALREELGPIVSNKGYLKKLENKIIQQRETIKLCIECIENDLKETEYLNNKIEEQIKQIKELNGIILKM